jgi:membrane-associated phospholipid phosphatase
MTSMTTVALVIVASMVAPQATTGGPPPAAVQARPSIGRHVLSDLRELVSPPSLMILAAGGLGAFAVTPKDNDVTRSFARADSLEDALDPGEIIGSGYVQFAAAAGTWIAGRATGHPRVAATGIDLLEAQLLNGAMTQGLKYAVARERPDGGRYSFPSGHTSAMFATATVIQHRFGWKAGVAAYAAGVYVGAGRLSDRQHHLSDVIFGAALGTVAGRAISISHGRRARVTATVMPIHGGAVVVLTRR